MFVECNSWLPGFLITLPQGCLCIAMLLHLPLLEMFRFPYEWPLLPVLAHMVRPLLQSQDLVNQVWILELAGHHSIQVRKPNEFELFLV